jgi:predicted ATPase/transcriptional regulator with XRE-family HTH domain
MLVGSLLKRHRVAAGLTQEELAERAQVSARTVSDVERGVRARVYKDTAGRLATALELDVAARSEFEASASGRQRQSVRSAPLPIPPTRLIGRDREVDLIVAALATPGIRLLTLTGPGGIGKTRVAVEVAAKLQGQFGGGVFVLPLGDIADSSLFIASVARAVGLTGAVEPTIEAIAEHIGPAKILMVLDTFEHVIEAAPLVANLLAACAGCAVLATSREALRIRGEHEMAIPTLDMPPTPTLEAVTEAAATMLFIERAIAVRPGLTIDAPAAGLIAKICGKLNGLPLAIELAAARTKHFSLTDLSEQLDRRLDFLTGGPRDLPQRQQTMRDTIAWSYNLLDSGEQNMLRDLAVFSGGWTLDSAAAVCARNVRDDLTALLDKSLVIRIDVDGPRYGMLDTVREFGSELGATPGTEERHTGYFLSLAEEAEPELGGFTQEEWLQKLGREHDNIRVSLHRAIARKDSETSLRIAGAIWRFWLLQGHLSEGRRWLADALNLNNDVDARWRAKGLWGSSWLAYHQGDYDAADRCGEEMLRLARNSNDPIDLRNALTASGIVDLAYGRYGDAIKSFDRCVELLRVGEAGWLLATSLMTLGMATTHGRDPRAREVLREAHEMYLKLGDQHYAARAVLYSGYVALLGGDINSASALFRETLISFWELDDLWGITEAVEGLAATAGADGHAERAAIIAGAAETLRERINARPFPSDRAVMERHLATSKATVGEPAWGVLLDRGRAMTVEAIVEFVLEEREAS